MNRRVTVNSNERLSRAKKGHASTPYNKHGKHFDRTRFKTTSSEAARPTLLKTALNARKKLLLALPKQHRNKRPRTK